MRDKSTDPRDFEIRNCWVLIMALGYIFGATQGGARETKVEFRGVPENFEKKNTWCQFCLSLCPDRWPRNLSRRWRSDSQSEGLMRRKKQSQFKPGSFFFGLFSSWKNKWRVFIGFFQPKVRNDCVLMCFGLSRKWDAFAGTGPCVLDAQGDVEKTSGLPHFTLQILCILWQMANLNFFWFIFIYFHHVYICLYYSESDFHFAADVWCLLNPPFSCLLTLVMWGSFWVNVHSVSFQKMLTRGGECWCYLKVLTWSMLLPKHSKLLVAFQKVEKLDGFTWGL